MLGEQSLILAVFADAARCVRNPWTFLIGSEKSYDDATRAALIKERLSATKQWLEEGERFFALLAVDERYDSEDLRSELLRRVEEQIRVFDGRAAPSQQGRPIRERNCTSCTASMIPTRRGGHAFCSSCRVMVY